MVRLRPHSVSSGWTETIVTPSRPVRSVDGRTVGDGHRGPMVARLQELYRELVDADVAARVAP